MILLRSIKLNDEIDASIKDSYPFNTEVLNSFSSLDFEKDVTFLVGENGSGKSTLLEGIAAATNSIVVGNDSIERDETLAPARALGQNLKLIWSKKSKRGFFLRAEDFFNFSRKIRAEKIELQEMADHYDRTLNGYARTLAMGTVLGQKNAYTKNYGEDLDANSHGESFLKLFQSRFKPGGLYILDEPEAALSPISQIALISMIKSMVAEDSQFIIATHSPILMAFPNADIVDLNEKPPIRMDYDDVEHVQITRAFLKNPENYLRRL